MTLVVWPADQMRAGIPASSSDQNVREGDPALVRSVTSDATDGFEPPSHRFGQWQRILLLALAERDAIGLRPSSRVILGAQRRGWR